MDQTTKDAFATLTETVERGFAAVTEDMTALKAELKSDIASIADQVAGIERDIRKTSRDQQKDCGVTRSPLSSASRGGN